MIVPAEVRLVSPADGTALTAADGALVDAAGNRFPIVDGIPRFVPSSEYASSFGFQWRRFARTQLDNPVFAEFSRARFFRSTGWRPEDLDDAVILEVGSGAGRFSRVVLQHTNAVLYSVDLSEAVDVNRSNNGAHERLRLFQASVYTLPFAPRAFARGFCLGVLQHTPDVERSIRCLAEMIRPGGELVVDFYPRKGWWTRIQAKYLIRPVTRRVDRVRLLQMIDRNVDWMLALAGALRRVGLGKLLGRFVPVADPRFAVLPDLPFDLVREMAVLDTFDMLSPAYDWPQRIETVARYFETAGLRVTFANLVTYAPGADAAVVRGTRD